MAESLAELLAQAAPRGPSALRSGQAGGAALALALHCLMVREGFQALDKAGRPLRGYAPPPEWNTTEHAWAFNYRRPGAPLTFRLQCAFQAATKRVFIHASEIDSRGEPVKDNIQIMGLQLPNYVPVGDQCATSSSWEGVIANERTLCDMFTEFVTAPLWRQAEKLPEDAAGSSGDASWASSLAGMLTLSGDQRRTALAVAAGVTAVAAGALLWSRRRSAADALSR